MANFFGDYFVLSVPTVAVLKTFFGVIFNTFFRAVILAPTSYDVFLDNIDSAAEALKKLVYRKLPLFSFHLATCNSFHA